MPSPFSALRNRAIRIRHLPSGFRAIVARQVYTEQTIPLLLEHLITAGHAQRPISHPCGFSGANRMQYHSVEEAAKFWTGNLSRSVASLGYVTTAQHAKITALGGDLIRVHYDDFSHDYYVFGDRVLGIMTISYIKQENTLEQDTIEDLWRQIADDCPTLESAANRYFNDNDNDAGTLDLVQVMARMAA